MSDINNLMEEIEKVAGGPVCISIESKGEGDGYSISVKGNGLACEAAMFYLLSEATMVISNGDKKRAKSKIMAMAMQAIDIVEEK